MVAFGLETGAGAAVVAFGVEAGAAPAVVALVFDAGVVAAVVALEVAVGDELATVTVPFETAVPVSGDAAALKPVEISADCPA